MFSITIPVPSVIVLVVGAIAIVTIVKFILSFIRGR